MKGPMKVFTKFFSEKIHDMHWEAQGELTLCLHQLIFCMTLTDAFPGHPRFFNQLSSGLDVIGTAAEWLISTANTNM